MITLEQKQKLIDFINSLEVEGPKLIKTKITEIGHMEAIHTETLAEYYRISILLHLAGKKWKSGDSYLKEFNYNKHKKDTCFEPYDNTFQGLKYHKNLGYTIIPSTQITGV